MGDPEPPPDRPQTVVSVVVGDPPVRRRVGPGRREPPLRPTTQGAGDGQDYVGHEDLKSSQSRHEYERSDVCPKGRGGLVMRYKSEN